MKEVRQDYLQLQTDLDLGHKEADQHNSINER
jgi:hypothetical protein